MPVKCKTKIEKIEHVERLKICGIKLEVTCEKNKEGKSIKDLHACS